jgi:hypothetical protein
MAILRTMSAPATAESMVISSPHTALNGGQDAQSKRFTGNRGGFLQADEFEPHKAWPVFQASSAKITRGQDVRPSQMTPQLGKSACARQRLGPAARKGPRRRDPRRESCFYARAFVDQSSPPLFASRTPVPLCSHKPQMAVSLKLQEPEAFLYCGSASSRSDWTAASITPDKTIRARARSNHDRALNDDRSSRPRAPDAGAEYSEPCAASAPRGCRVG